MELLAAVAVLPDWLLFSFAGGLGLIVGSFLNVVIHRLPRDESLVRPGSHCPRCEQSVAWYDNVVLHLRTGETLSLPFRPSSN